jgi:hypothetical protein
VSIPTTGQGLTPTENVGRGNVELNPICYWLALLGGYPIFHISRIGVNLDTLNKRDSFNDVLLKRMKTLQQYVYNTTI